MTGISQPAMPPDPILWRGMRRAELDAGYNNSAAVADSADRIADWSRRSAALRSRQPALLNQTYGPRKRNTIDIFKSGRGEAPLLVFIHGGYWQRNSKDVFSCMAHGPLAAGVDVAVPGYTLAPEATLGEIVAEMRAALQWLRRDGPALGIATRRLIVSGWSAGGHLAATAMSWPEVDAGLSISGVFDLEPIRLGVLNDKLGLSASDVSALSPLHHIPTVAGPLAIAYGTAELPELQRQSQQYAQAWAGAALHGTLLPIAAKNHFSILEELASSAGTLTAQIKTLSS